MGFYSVPPMVVIMIALFWLAATPLFNFVDTPNTNPHTRVETLDGLRGFLALAVFFHHGALYHTYELDHVWRAPPHRLYALLGPMGVSIFFMITGFLFWSQMVGKSGRPDWLRLYVGRVFRIGPIYLVAVGCMIVSVFALTGFRLRVSPSTLLSQLFAWSLLGLRAGNSLNGFTDPGVLLANVTWSLRYEWLFYFSLPFTAIFARRRWSAALLPGLFGLGGIALCLHGEISGKPVGDAAFVALFCIGMLTAVHRSGPKLPRRLDHPAYSLLTISLFALVVCLFDTSYKAAPILILGAAFFLIANGASLFGLLTSRPARRLGDISFGIYLLQGLLLALFFGVAAQGEASDPSPWIHWIIVGAASFGLVLAALAAHVFVELPGIRLGRDVLARRSAARGTKLS